MDQCAMIRERKGLWGREGGGGGSGCEDFNAPFMLDKR